MSGFGEPNHTTVTTITNTVSGSYLPLSGGTLTGTLALTGATTTAVNGIDIASGCFSINGVCLTAGTGSAHAEAENALSGALKSVFALAESYPDLKANTNFLELQRELSDTENKIQSARRFYNGNVRDYNTMLQVFPSNILANLFKFSKKEFFDIPDNGAESQPVSVQF
jgi:hypothetical protein